MQFASSISGITRALLVVIPLLLSCGLSHAVAMLYTFTGTGTGSVNGASFTDTTFSIRLWVPNVVYDNTIYYAEASSTALEITGTGSGSFTKPVRAFFNTGGAIVGISNSATGNDLLNIQNEFFRGYNMKRDLGPRSVGDAYLTLFRNYATTLGNFSLTKATDMTFTATVIPEPSSPILGFTALAAAAAGSRRRR